MKNVTQTLEHVRKFTLCAAVLATRALPLYNSERIERLGRWRLTMGAFYMLHKSNQVVNNRTMLYFTTAAAIRHITEIITKEIKL